MRHLIAYLLFVGVPFAGLLGILRIGDGIAAPLAIRGAYAVTTTTVPSSPCLLSLLGADSALTVTQSGQRLSITLGDGVDVSMSGVLHASAIRASGFLRAVALARHGSRCQGQLFGIEATVRRHPDAKRITGFLIVGACPDCERLPFVAARPRGYPGKRLP